MAAPQGLSLPAVAGEEHPLVKPEQKIQQPSVTTPPASSSILPLPPTEVASSAATTATQDRSTSVTSKHPVSEETTTREEPTSSSSIAIEAPAHDRGTQDAPLRAAEVHAPEPRQRPPSTGLDLTSFGESNLEAIAAAQIAAGLGDFDFGSNTPEQATAASASSAQEEGTGITVKVVNDSTVSDRPSQGINSSTPKPPYRPTTAVIAPQTANFRSIASLPQTAAPTSSIHTANFLFSNGPQMTGVKPMPSRPVPSTVQINQNRSNTAVPAGLSVAQPRPMTGALAAAPNGTTPLAQGSSPIAMPAKSPASLIARPAPLQVNANGLATRPQMPPTNPRPMAPNAAMRPPPPRPGGPGAPLPSGRPPQSGPSMGGRPPGPALPASALFSQGPPGMPSFASLLGSLSPQDLAMVAHAAMGLDANGDPLPGNEESHRALADAMRKLRESAAVRPPPHMFRPPYQQQSHPHYQNGVPLPRPPLGQSSMMARPRPPPKMMKPRPMKLPKQPPQDAWILARAASEGGSIGTLGKTGDPLQDKLPLIAGPRPDRAPPRGGPPPEKRFQCPKCDRAFARAYNLNTHFATHDPDPNRAKPFPCPYPSCKSEFRSFSRKHDLQRHIASTHEAEPEPIIEIADAETGETIQSNLAKLGLGAPGRKFRCECGRAFVRRDALRKHSCEAMRGHSLADLEASSHSPAGDPRGGYGRRHDEADALARRAAGLPVISGSSSDSIDFESLAASFAADAAQEMQAAQEHAARQGGDEDDEDDEDPDDAIAKFASQLTAGAAAQLGIYEDEDEEDEDEGEDGDEDEGISAEVQAAMDAKAAASRPKAKTPPVTVEAVSGGVAIDENELDDAAAQYISQLQSELGGDEGSSTQLNGIEGLMASHSGDAAPHVVDRQGSVIGRSSGPAQAGPLEEQQVTQQNQQKSAAEMGQDNPDHRQQQQSRKRTPEEAPQATPHQVATSAAWSAPHLSKRIKREDDEEYDQLGEEAGVKQEEKDAPAPPFVPETSIPA